MTPTRQFARRISDRLRAGVGFTHRRSEQFWSTFTRGYVILDNTSGRESNFYHTSQYANANVVWQLRKRLSIGLEGLYGLKETRHGMESGNLWWVQSGMV